LVKINNLGWAGGQELEQQAPPRGEFWVIFARKKSGNKHRPAELRKNKLNWRIMTNLY